MDDVEETNSLANTSIYGHLNELEDVESFYNFYNKTKKEREIENSEEKPRGTPVETYMESTNELAIREPDLHYQNLRAKIRLKVSKDYQEDVVLRKARELAELEPPIEIRDQYGRLI